LLVRAGPAHPDAADPARVILELVSVGLVPVEFVDHENAGVAPGANAGLRAHLEYAGAIRPADVRAPALRVARRGEARVGQHRDPRFGVLETGQPGLRFDDLPVLVRLGVLAEVPDRPVIVLDEE